jgi:hypothetical protein
MEFRDTLSRANGLVERVTDHLAFIAPLATRLVIGLAFFQAGTGKFRNFENVIGFFDSLGIPFPAFNAGLVASMETVGGVMLIFPGRLGRRFAALTDRRDRFRLPPLPALARVLRRRQAEPRRPVAQNSAFGAGGFGHVEPGLALIHSTHL